MKVYTDFYEFSDLQKNCWSGALQTLSRIEEEEKESELMDMLEDIFYNGIELTELNDFLWFDTDYIYESLGIEEE